MQNQALREPRFVASKYQTAIFNWVKTGRGDAVVEAVAGSGKTTTLIQAASLISTRNVLFVAFNSHIVKELESKLPPHFTVLTVHSLGYKSCQRAFGRLKLDETKYTRLAREAADPICSVKNLSSRERSDLIDSIKKLVNFCRLTLTDPSDGDAFKKMISEFSIEITWEFLPILTHTVQQILKNGELLAKKAGQVDYTDMIWLPCKLNLPLTQTFLWVLADECQDFSNAQRQIVLKARATGGRILFVGDSRQAIFGFAGANARSFTEIAKETGAITLPLSVCYRCPDSHLQLAREIVPYCESRDGAPAGEIRTIPEPRLYSEVGEGDLVLCRLTAPLVSACLALIAQGVPARVRGREIGAGLVSVVRQIEKHEQYRWEDFDKLLGEWTNWKVSQLRRRDGTEDAVQATEDKASAIRAVFLSKPFRNAMDLILAIEKLFSNDNASVWLSTIHRAKGLEADRVFILRPKKLPLEWATQQEWQRDQELNLKYVALTRARKSLIFCEETPGATEKT